MIDGYIRIFRHWTELQLWGQMATTDANMRAWLTWRHVVRL
jgi:hypothetical protein